MKQEGDNIVYSCIFCGEKSETSRLENCKCANELGEILRDADLYRIHTGYDMSIIRYNNKFYIPAYFLRDPDDVSFEEINISLQAFNKLTSSFSYIKSTTPLVAGTIYTINFPENKPESYYFIDTID